MKFNLKYKKIVPHLLGWGAVFFINIFVLSTVFSDQNDGEYWGFISLNIPVWVVYVLLFYANLTMFVPRLLFKSKYLKYILLVLVVSTAISVGITYYKQHNFRQKMKVEILNESRRADITVYRKNRGIKRLEQRIENSYNSKYFNPFHGLNVSTTYGILLIIISGISIATISKWRSREEIVEEIKRQKTESELAYLKQQINPHFLFNALNSIYSLVLPHSDQASDVVLKLSSILRYMLYETDQDKVSLEKELEIIADYIELQKLKCTDVSDIQYSFDGNFLSYSIEPLLMLPFVENAFKYGTNNVDRTHMRIVVRCIDDKLVFEISNKILNNKKIDTHSGIGIKNISRRLDIIYGKDYVLNIKNEDDIFSVKMVIPLIVV